MKEDGWWLVLGDEARQELYAIKRTSFGERASARLSYTAASADEAANLQLQLVSPLNQSIWILESDLVLQPQRASTSTHSCARCKGSPGCTLN